MSSVLQPWVEELPMMQQGVLLSAVRAPDGVSKNHPSKLIWRWLRRCFLISAFEHRIIARPNELGGGSFTGPVKDAWAAAQAYFYHVDSIPHHAHMHMVHAAEMLGFKHPDFIVRAFWNDFYIEAANDMHLAVEMEDEMDRRLSDDEEQWRKTERFPA